MHGPETASKEIALLTALRCGDEDAFNTLVDTYGAAMHRVALTFVRSTAVATASKAGPPSRPGYSGSWPTSPEPTRSARRAPCPSPHSNSRARLARSTRRPSPPTAFKAP